ncbi:hypothetical protein EDB80DRAFT_407659 [Ilyonectria destructans]|nr:hypothetical protein EDB80DRAFT_407659 [Ilyonectria destructans]
MLLYIRHRSVAITASLSIWTNATLGIYARRPNCSPAGRQPGRQSPTSSVPRSLKVAPIHQAPAIINTSMTCPSHNSPNSPSTPGTHHPCRSYSAMYVLPCMHKSHRRCSKQPAARAAAPLFTLLAHARLID